MSGDQLSLDGCNELEPGTLFGAPVGDSLPAVDGPVIVRGGEARYVDAEGWYRCAACSAHLVGPLPCRRCARIGAEAQELAPIVLESSCAVCGTAVGLTRKEMFAVYPITCLAHRD